jgi:hypothetical protein
VCSSAGRECEGSQPCLRPYRRCTVKMYFPATSRAMHQACGMNRSVTRRLRYISRARRRRSSIAAQGAGRSYISPRTQIRSVQPHLSGKFCPLHSYRGLPARRRGAGRAGAGRAAHGAPARNLEHLRCRLRRCRAAARSNTRAASSTPTPTVFCGTESPVAPALRPTRP